MLIAFALALWRRNLLDRGLVKEAERLSDDELADLGIRRRGQHGRRP